MPDQIRIEAVPALALVQPQGDPNGGPVYEDFVVEALSILGDGDLDGLVRAAETMLELSNPDLWLASALRWLLVLIENAPVDPATLSVVIESLRHLSPIAWHEQAATPVLATLESPPQQVTPAVAESLPGLSAEEAAALEAIVAVQREILGLPIDAAWQMGRVKGASSALAGCLRASGREREIAGLDAATATALDEVSAEPLLAWLEEQFSSTASEAPDVVATTVPACAALTAPMPDEPKAIAENESDQKFGRSAEDATTGAKSLKVDQVKIDRLMNLIGEIVVAKNALPYLAGRAESVFGVRELSREIKTQYAVINRIAEEMQGAIMQVRMMPVSFVFQRFPRLVRDISRKLGKEVNLVLEGEETEADKNIIESLGDPLVHIVRNSLDHGFETPDVRRAAGKPAAGTLTIRASQESDRAVIEICDDGKGIDAAVIKRKAYEKGLIDEATLERISDQDAVNLVFAAGFSTAEVVSDLSGRGVGMDVVRTAVEKVNGAIFLESEKGKGTCIRLSLPLSMAVTNVMIVESDGQTFGMPMDCVVETVRVSRSDIRTIKKSLATVLRGRIVPLKSINSLLGLNAPPLANEEDELAVLVVRLGDESVGLLVDDFRETIDIILKPLTGVLAGLTAYSGSALMGDGSVLMVLNIKELL
jgi:two-component system chemotaxis sensor kinase CheA